VIGLAGAVVNFQRGQCSKRDEQNALVARQNSSDCPGTKVREQDRKVAWAEEESRH